MHSIRVRSEPTTAGQLSRRGLRILYAGERADELREVASFGRASVDVADYVVDLERARRQALSEAYDVAFVRSGSEAARRFGREVQRTGLTWFWIVDDEAPSGSDLDGQSTPVGAAMTIRAERIAGLRDSGMAGVDNDWLAFALSSIADRVKAVARRDDMSTRLGLVAEGSRDGLWEWELHSDRLLVSDRWLAMLGLERDTDRQGYTAREDWLERLSSEDLAGVETAIREHLESGSTHFECEARMRHADGSWLWVVFRGAAARDAHGRATTLAGSQTDISAEKLRNGELVRGALYDDLTGLPGRALFLDRVSHCLSRVRRQGGKPFALLFLDLDRFKQVNDTWGHRAGDRLLVSAARRIEFCVRPGDTAARISGDEFAVLLEDIADPDDALSVVQRLSRDLSAPFGLGEGQVELSASIGLVHGSARFERPEDIVSEADAAMYRAKRAGSGIELAGNCATVMARSSLEDDLRGALGRQEFRLAYQPVFRLDTGKLAGFEALLRWERHELGLLESSEFIRVAEHAGLLNRLGPWVLGQAARDLCALRSAVPAASKLQISLNVSASELARPDFAREVGAALEESGLGSEGLCFEIPELALKQWSDAACGVLAALSDLGFGLCIDDFGAAGAAVPLLSQLPVTSLKLASRLVNQSLPFTGAARDRSDARSAASIDGRLLKALVGLAHDLGLGVTAKGIERDEQLARVRALGCEWAQGFLLGRPLPGQDLPGFVSSSPVL